MVDTFCFSLLPGLKPIYTHVRLNKWYTIIALMPLFRAKPVKSSMPELSKIKPAIPPIIHAGIRKRLKTGKTERKNIPTIKKTEIQPIVTKKLKGTGA